MAGRRRRGEDGGVSRLDYEGGSPYLDEWEQSQERLAVANPFLGASVGFGPLSPRGQEATRAYEEESARLPNVLVRPPGDFGGMTTERQLAWQQNLKAQQELETGLLQSESARRQQEFQDISRKEGLEIVRQSGGLDPTKPEEYRAKKAALIRQFPGGATSPEAQAIFAELDKRRDVVESASEEEKKAIASAERSRGEGNFTTARAQAAELGPEFLGNFLEISKAQGPDAAVAYVGREGARRKEAGLRTQLQAQGMTPEEVTTAYGGGAAIPLAEGLVAPSFQFPAAEEAAKGKNIGEQRRQARMERHELMKLKQQAFIQAGGVKIDDPERANKLAQYGWGPAEEAELADANARYDALTGRPIGQRPTPTQSAPAQPAAPSKAPEAPVYTKRKRNPTTGKMVGLNAKTNTWEVIP
jgi:hypothetical protein